MVKLTKSILHIPCDLLLTQEYVSPLEMFKYWEEQVPESVGRIIVLQTSWAS